MTELKFCSAAAPAWLISPHLRGDRPFRFGASVVSDDAFDRLFSHLLNIRGRYAPKRLNNGYQDEQPVFPIRFVLPTYMGCKITDSLSIFGLRFGESFDSGCHIMRVEVFPPCSVQFVEDVAPLGRAQLRNEAYAMFGTFVYSVGKVSRPAAPRAWAHCGVAQMDARTRTDCNRVRTPKCTAVIAHGWEQVRVACHCRGKLAPSDTPVAGSGPFRKGPRRYAHLGERCRSCGRYRAFPLNHSSA